MITQVQADTDPCLVPHWQWQAILEEGRKTTPTEAYPDQVIADAVALLRGQPSSRASAINQARQIFEDDGLVRAELEARVLADESVEEIAACCQVLLEVVTLYEQLFFCVRRYLDSSDWVIGATVGSAHRDGFRNDQLRQLWAWLAYTGGPLIIDHIIDVFRRVAGPHPPCRIDPYLKKGAAVPNEVQVAIANLVIPADEDGLRCSLDLHVRRKELAQLPEADVRCELKRDADQAVIKYARRVLAGKPRSWKPLSKFT